MIKQHDAHNFRFPYIWPSAITGNVLPKIKKPEGFTHLHLIGDAGSGKTRCITEILKLQSKKNNSLILKYSSPRDGIFDSNILIDFQNQINAQLNAKTQNTENDICNVITGISKDQNIILFIEDLHYQDDLRDSFIIKLINELNESPSNITFITSSRDSFTLTRATNSYDISIQNLSEAEARQLIKAGEEENQKIKSLTTQLLENSNGSPLFISETMNMVLTTNDDHDFSLDDDINDINTLYDAILASLNQIEQTILKAASVIGRKFKFNDLQYLLPEHTAYLRSILNSLIEHHIIEHHTVSDVYSFKHDIQYDQFYKNINKNDLWSWHLALAQKHETQRQYDLCGYHYFFAEAYEKSIKYLTFTARKYIKKAQPRKAELFFLKAFDAYEKANSTNKETYLKLRIDYCYSLLMQGYADNARNLLRTLKDATHQNNTKIQKQLSELNIQLTWMSGNYNKQYALETLGNMPNTPDFFTDRSRLLGMLTDIGEHKESIKGIHDLLNDMAKQRFWKNKTFSSIQTTCFVYLSLNHVALGNKKIALKYINQNIKQINQTKDTPQKIHTLTFTTKALHELGMFQEAKPLIEKAYIMNLEFKIGVINPHILAQYAHNLAFFNHTIRAIELFSECITFTEKHGFLLEIPYQKTLMAEAFSSIGMDIKALEILLEAEQATIENKNKNFMAIVCYKIFKIIQHESSHFSELLDKTPKDYLNESLSLALELDLKPLVEKCKKWQNKLIN